MREFAAASVRKAISAVGDIFATVSACRAQVVIGYRRVVTSEMGRTILPSCRRHPRICRHRRGCLNSCILLNRRVGELPRSRIGTCCVYVPGMRRTSTWVHQRSWNDSLPVEVAYGARNLKTIETRRGTLIVEMC